ncbi:MAG: protein kinase, partial [Gemmatimonadaceae bacterium]
AYTLERELGGGGMSRVFVAEDTTLERKVVIKVLPPELAAAVNVERFKREIQLTAKLQHPNIVPVLSSGVTDVLPFYMMPFIEGESLRARISREGELPTNEVMKILRDVLSALAYAHERGIVHRDIKPDNVLLTKYNSQVTDFGIAKALTASATKDGFATSLGVAIGTPAYMAPEQVVADPTIDHRADLYSAGVMAYEMLTGSQIFGGRSSPQAVMAAQAVERPAPIDSKRRSVPPALSALIMRALEKQAADRPQSAEEMLNVLDQLATPGGGSIATVRPSPVAESTATSNRTRIVAIAAFLTVVLGIAFLIRPRPSNQLSPRLAVLPFENGGADSDAYFADGMTEAITNRLASISGLTVIGRQSAKRYVGSKESPQQIGSELGVNYLLTGSVRWDKSQRGRNIVSVRPALLRTADGSQVWGEPYEAVLSGEFKLESDVAEHVARALDVALLPHESRAIASKPTNDTIAYDDYLKGRFFLNKRTTAGVQQALDYFNKAVSRDPNFARAYAGLAEVYVVLPTYTDATVDSSWAGIRKYAAIAIRLDSTLAAPHAALGSILKYEHHWAEAEAEFKKAIALEPGYPTTYQWYSRMVANLGRIPEALALAEKAQKLDPLSPILNLNLGTIQLYSGRYDAADSTLKSTIMMDPANPNARFTYSTLLVVKKEYAKAIAQLDTAISFTSNGMNVERLTIYRAVARAYAGDTAAARAALNQVNRNPRKGELGYELSLLHMSLSEKDSAIAWVAHHMSGLFSDALFFRVPFFDPIRDNPEFKAAINRALHQ